MKALIPPDKHKVIAVKHWTDELFSFSIERPNSFRFRSGEFTMVGLIKPNDGKPLWRAYSIASPAWDNTLEFYSIKVQDGPLTSLLQHITPYDDILLNPKPVGTLVHDALTAGKRLFLFSTGTGFAPFASIIRDPATYERFEKIYLTHTCRHVSDLQYSQHIVSKTLTNELFGNEAKAKLVYFPTTTREHSQHNGRITDLLHQGVFVSALNLSPFDVTADRIMVCGSLAFNQDIKAWFINQGFTEGSNANPGDLVIEKAFVG